MKSLKSIRIFFILAALMTLCCLSFAQSEDEQQHVTIKLYKNLDKSPLGSQLKVAVKVNIEEGWHINSDMPNDEFLIPTSFDLLSDENFEIERIEYPDSVILNLTFSQEPVSVFEGEFFLSLVINVPKDIKLGEHQIPVELFYQACNDMTCEPPQTAKATLSIAVVDTDTPVKEINKEIFAKIKLTK